MELFDDDGDRAGALSSLEASGDCQRLLVEPRNGRTKASGDERGFGGESDHIAAGDIDVVFEVKRHAEWCAGALAIVTEHVDLGDPRCRAGWQGHDLVADGDRATVDTACETTNVMRTFVVSNDPLHRHAEGRLDHGWVKIVQDVQDRWSVVPGRLGRVLSEVDTVECREWNRSDPRSVDLSSGRNELVGDLDKTGLVVVDKIDLIDTGDHVAHAEHAADREVSTGLRCRAVLCINQQDRCIRTRSGRHHVARVLHVPRRVTKQDAPAIGIEGTVGNIDGDALLALGAQAVGQ